MRRRRSSRASSEMSTWNGRISVAVSTVLLITTSVYWKCGVGLSSSPVADVRDPTPTRRGQATAVTRTTLAAVECDSQIDLPSRECDRTKRVLEFRILGALEALEDGRPVDLGGSRQRALL